MVCNTNADSLTSQPSGGERTFSSVDLTNPWLQCDPVILPTCHLKELDLDGLACHEFELPYGVFLINLSREQLDSLFLSREAWDKRVVENELMSRSPAMWLESGDPRLPPALFW